jgi:pyridoxamine 5'-phosphate oxidase family protein
MKVEDAHARYLLDHSEGCLATVTPNGTPQNKPVGYRYDPRTGTIDIAGFGMEHSAKYRNIATNPRIAFVINDSVGEGPGGMRFLEVRGRAEQVQVQLIDAGDDGISSHVIRIHPQRIVSWNADPDQPGLRIWTNARQAERKS